MKFGLWYASVGPLAFSEPTIAVAQAAEAAGFESLWAGDHIVIPAEYESTYPYTESGRLAVDGPIPMAEVMVWAAHLAAVTSTIKVATGVLVLPQREPVLLAKQAASIAVLSGGRLILGVGAGWLAEEFAAVGADFATRGARLDEYIAAIRELWAHDSADFAGQFVQFSGAQLAPRPPGDSVPIVIGGDSMAAARRAGRMGDGWFPAKADRASLPALLKVMSRAADEAGRDPADIEITVSDSSLWNLDTAADTIAAWAELGVGRIILSPQTLDTRQLGQHLANFGAEVLQHVNH
jgi:probable F420-dependent oxidoreductase